MADSRIKKVVVANSSLPGVGSNSKYLVRFRVVSEDKNRFSHWSPIYSIDGLPVTQVEGTVDISGRFTVVVWGDEPSRPSYDIFVKFDDGDYVYHGTSSTHTYSFINTGTTNVRVAVQVQGINKTRSEALTIFESEVLSLI